MGMFTKAECEVMRNRVLGNAPPPPNRRAKVGTGTTAKQKRWFAEMARGDGIFLPLVTKSEANMRDRWDIIKRAKTNRTYTTASLFGRISIEQHMILNGTPLRVTLTRYSTRLLDDDNLQRSLKAVRDGIADAFNVDDGSPLYQWAYKQEKGPTYGVRIEITSVADAGEGKGE